MTIQPLRSYTGVAIAIIVAALIVGSVAYLTVSATNKTITKVETTTVTSTPTNSTGVRAYAVTFQQVRECGQYNIMPWAVTLNGLTQVQPSNQTLPLPTNYFSTIVSNQNLTRITFSVPSGTYSYTVTGGTPNGPGGELYPGSGTIHVNGSDVLVNVGVYLSITCTSTTS
jgi:hypothetical protein